MGGDTRDVHRCRWPGGCDQDAATIIGTTSLQLFHCCHTHAKVWRGLSYLEMVAVHEHLEPRNSRSVAHSAGPPEYRDDIGVRDRDIGGNIYS